jgi:hypothetical protein
VKIATSWQFFRRKYLKIITLTPAANPTVTSYNASAVNFYNATGSLHSAFWKQKYFIPHWKNAPALYNASVVVG